MFFVSMRNLFAGIGLAFTIGAVVWANAPAPAKK